MDERSDTTEAPKVPLGNVKPPAGPPAATLRALNDWAVERGHVNTFNHGTMENPGAAPEGFDVSAQRAFILAMIKAHCGHGTERHPIGKLVTGADYDKLTGEVMDLKIGEQITESGAR